VDDLLIGQPSTFNHVRDPNRAGCIGDGGFDVLCAADFLTVDANNDIARPDTDPRRWRVRANRIDR